MIASKAGTSDDSPFFFRSRRVTVNSGPEPLNQFVNIPVSFVSFQSTARLVYVWGGPPASPASPTGLHLTSHLAICDHPRFSPSAVAVDGFRNGYCRGPILRCASSF